MFVARSKDFLGSVTALKHMLWFLTKGTKPSGNLRQENQINVATRGHGGEGEDREVIDDEEGNAG